MRNYAGSALMLMVTIAAAVGCYTINLQVAGERAAVERLRYRLVVDARDMRNLQAEVRTRARLPEMQRWNDQVLQMSAPAAGQFVRSPVQLASFGTALPATSAAAVGPAVSYAVTAPAPAAPATAAVVTVAYVPQARVAYASTTRVPDASPARVAYASPARAAYAPAAPIVVAEAARIIRASYPAKPHARAAATSMAAEIGASLDAAAPRNLLPPEGQ